MSNYPDWVNAFKEKGTSVKRSVMSTTCIVPLQSGSRERNIRSLCKNTSEQ